MEQSQFVLSGVRAGIRGESGGFASVPAKTTNRIGTRFAAVSVDRTGERGERRRAAIFEALVRIVFPKSQHRSMPLVECTTSNIYQYWQLLHTSQVHCLPIQYTHTRRLKTDPFLLQPGASGACVVALVRETRVCKTRRGAFRECAGRVHFETDQHGAFALGGVRGGVA